MNKVYFEEMKKIVMNGLQTKDTYERVAIDYPLHDATWGKLEEMGVDINTIIKVMLKAQAGDKQEVVGPYIVHHYIDMVTQLEEVAQSMGLENIESRQFIITFPKMHCFQSIQFLIRQGEKGTVLTTIGSMRSCNLLKNFLTDLGLVYYCAMYIQSVLKDKEVCTIDQIDVIMNIGSLHIFKSEV